MVGASAGPPSRRLPATSRYRCPRRSCPHPRRVPRPRSPHRPACPWRGQRGSRRQRRFQPRLDAMNVRARPLGSLQRRPRRCRHQPPRRRVGNCWRRKRLRGRVGAASSASPPWGPACGQGRRVQFERLPTSLPRRGWRTSAVGRWFGLFRRAAALQASRFLTNRVLRCPQRLLRFQWRWRGEIPHGLFLTDVSKQETPPRPGP